ncbi:hypothetical protein [Dyadobacter sediminis]|nr:hypothetical protein [Dyadobacter sediminis]
MRPDAPHCCKAIETQFAIGSSWQQDQENVPHNDKGIDYMVSIALLNLAK